MLGKKTIGIHLRGKFVGNEVNHVPESYLFDKANEYAKLGYQCYIATDQQHLLDDAKSQLQGSVIYYDTIRYGKTTSPFAPQQLTPKHGEDILI